MADGSVFSPAVSNVVMSKIARKVTWAAAAAAAGAGRHKELLSVPPSVRPPDCDISGNIITELLLLGGRFLRATKAAIFEIVPRYFLNH